MSELAFAIGTAVLYFMFYNLFVYMIRRYTHCSPNAPSNVSIRGVMSLYRERCAELERMAEERGIVLDD
jgi:hypothetical protein